MEIRITEETVLLRMTLTTPVCGYGFKFMSYVKVLKKRKKKAHTYRVFRFSPLTVSGRSGISHVILDLAL